MKALYNGMLSPLLVQRLQDLWPGSVHVIAEYGETYPAMRALFPGLPPQVVRLLIGNSRTAAVETYIREHAAEIEQFLRSGERYLEI